MSTPIPLAASGFPGSVFLGPWSQEIAVGAGSRHDVSSPRAFSAVPGASRRDVVLSCPANEWAMAHGISARLATPGSVTFTLDDTVSARAWLIAIERNLSTQVAQLVALDCGGSAMQLPSPAVFKRIAAGDSIDHQPLWFAVMDPARSAVTLRDARSFAQKVKRVNDVIAIINPEHGDLFLPPTGPTIEAIQDASGTVNLRSRVDDSGWVDVTLSNPSTGGWTHDSGGGVFEDRVQSRLLNGVVHVRGAAKRTYANFDGNVTIQSGGLIGTVTAAHRPGRTRGVFLSGSNAPNGGVMHVIVQADGGVYGLFSSISIPVAGRLTVDFSYAL